MTGAPRIFLQIASYRDRDLPATMASADAAADDRDRLRYGVCHQYDDEGRGDLAAWGDDVRVRVDAVDHRESRGVGWARSRANALYTGEEWMLQIDAHTRFADGWDRDLLAMIDQLDVERPILSIYPAPFGENDDGSEKRADYPHPVRMGLREISPDATTRQLMDECPGVTVPGRQLLLAAGFLFAPGRFCRDVPYDPETYFEGEEVAMALRAFTHGYDLYFPTRQVVWHRYHHGAPLHWEDVGTAQADLLSSSSLDRLARLVRGAGGELGPYGVGTLRTVEAFERAAGFRFPGRVGT